MCEGAIPWCEHGDLLGVAEKFCMLCFEGVTLGFFSFMGICAEVAAEVAVMLVESCDCACDNFGYSLCDALKPLWGGKGERYVFWGDMDRDKICRSKGR